MAAFAAEAPGGATRAADTATGAAAEAMAHGAEAGAAWYASPDFWVFVAFVMFVALIARTAYRLVTVALDDRANRIRNQIDEATRLAAEAQDLLAAYERKQREATREAEAILDEARREADRIAEQAGKDLQAALARRERLAMDRIAQAEQAAINDVRTTAIDLALAATERILSGTQGARQADALIDAAIADLPGRVRLQ